MSSYVALDCPWTWKMKMGDHHSYGLDIVKISNGTETKEIKFKKAQSLIDSGDWKII